MNNDRSHRWLSRGAEVLVQQVEEDPDGPHCDVLIVGSGYGGAVAAARLAGARPKSGGDPLRVLVLERGNEYLPGEFPATFAELPGHVRFSQQDGQPPRGRPSGLFDLRLGKDVCVLLGNGLGGGSLINAAVMERPTRDAFAAGTWPDGIDADTLEPYYREALAMLEPETIPQAPEKLASLLAAGAQMRAPEVRKAQVAVAFADGVTRAGVKVAKCLECGDCVSGCNFRAKKSLDVNYLALAQAKCAQLYSGGTVRCIHALGNDQGYEVEFFLTDPLKARSDTRPYRLRARRVILAAGSLGSTEILMRSRAHGLPVPEAALGKGFSTNGDLIAVAYGQKHTAHCATAEGVAPDQRKVGPTITGLIRTRADSERPLVFEEFGIPAPLYRLLGEVVTTTGVLHGRFDPDFTVHRPGERIDDPLAVNAALVDRTLVYGMMGDDGAAGTLELRAGAARSDGQVAIAWPDVGRLPLFDRQLAKLREAHEEPGGCGGRVLPNPLWRPLPSLDGLLGQQLPPGPVVTVHPLGGCRMAHDASGGVVDHAGRVFAAGDAGGTLPGLAVLDGSIVPVSLGINPSLTIAALAERAMPILADAWDLELDASLKSHSQDRPVRHHLSRPKPPAPTRFTLHERMLGQLMIDNEPFDASALIDFAAAEAGGLRKLPRVIDLARVEITLTRPSDRNQSWTLRCAGRAEVLVRDHSDFVSRWVRALGPARRRLARFAPFCKVNNRFGGLRTLLALCSHLGSVRLIRYTCTVTEADPGAPFDRGAELCLTKRIAFTDGGSPWRQLSEGILERTDGCNVELGTMETDLTYFAEQMVALLKIESQQDAPNAIGDLAELALWILRVVLDIHLLNFLPAEDAFNKSAERLPGTVNGVDPVVVPMPTGNHKGAPLRQLSRYQPAVPQQGARPVLLIHGYGASGSTFAHRSIGPDGASRPLVSSLLAAGRDVWVLELRTSIGLPQNKTRAWMFDETANEDIPDAIAEVLRLTGQGEDGVVDVVAHCIGAAMFTVAVLSSARELHKHIGCVVLSQVAPLVAGSPMNRFRAYAASYLEQYLGIQWFDTRPDGDPLTNLLVDAILNTFPYPDDDGEAERLHRLPGFAAVRHRADAIFGQTMRLSSISDQTLRALDAIYGFVSVPGLAQVGHYVSQQVLTDAAGQNQTIAFETIARRFGFPLLILHGRHNRVFDWRGSYRAMALLKQVFDKALLAAQPPEVGAEGLLVGAGTPRQLRVLGEYGHQDTLIGQYAHRDVFPHIVEFLDRFASTRPTLGRDDPPLVARAPWTGPTLGAVRRVSDNELVCRLALRPPRGHASTLAVVFVPATRDEQGWHFDFARLAARFVSTADLIERALELPLRVSQLASHQGFAVVTVHTTLPLPLDRTVVVQTVGDKGSLFLNADDELTPPAREVVERWFASTPADAIDETVVRLDPAWIAAAQMPGQPPQRSLRVAFASCQYPAGLFDTSPAEASYARLAKRLDSQVDSARPQLLLLMGDQVYVDETAGLFALPGASSIERSYEVNHRLPAYRRVTRSLPTYPLLDDHEVQDNWEPPPPVPGALAAYVQRQHKLVNDDAAPPFHHGIAPAGIPIIALDTRSTRDRRTLRPQAGAALLADAQIAAGAASSALEQRLASQIDPQLPKLIISPVAMFPFQRAAAFGHPAERIALDDWGGFPRSQNALLSAVRDQPVRNVILLSGDRHLSSVSSLWLERADETEIEIISIVSSRLYAPWPFANARPDEHWLNGPFEMSDGSLRGRMETPLICGADGFAVISLELADDGVWTLEVALDLADGQRHARKPLDGNPAGRWQVW